MTRLLSTGVFAAAAFAALPGAAAAKDRVQIALPIVIERGDGAAPRGSTASGKANSGAGSPPGIARP